MAYYGKTEIILCDSYQELGRIAASDVAKTLRRVLSSQVEARIIFAAAESQVTFLDSLAVEAGIDWNRVTCFNMDEFWGPDLPVSVTCSYQISTQLYDKVRPKAWYAPLYSAPDPVMEARRFAEVFRSQLPIDILCQGIGRSGHLALNEPGAALLEDVESVRVVDVCEESTHQLMDDPQFKVAAMSLRKGITLTIPSLMSARHHFTMVPLATKRSIMSKVLRLQAVSHMLPASIIMNYSGRLYMDQDSYPGDYFLRQ